MIFEIGYCSKKSIFKINRLSGIGFRTGNHFSKNGDRRCFLQPNGYFLRQRISPRKGKSQNVQKIYSCHEKDTYKAERPPDH